MTKEIEISQEAIEAAAFAVANHYGHETDHAHRTDAKLTLAATAPLLLAPLEQIIAGQAAQIERANGNITLLAAEVKRLKAQIEGLGEQIAQQIEQIPTQYGSGTRRDVNRVIETAANIARDALAEVHESA